jgi:hypothetical protein
MHRLKLRKTLQTQTSPAPQSPSFVQPDLPHKLRIGLTGATHDVLPTSPLAAPLPVAAPPEAINASNSKAFHTVPDRSQSPAHDQKSPLKSCIVSPIVYDLCDDVADEDTLNLGVNEVISISDCDDDDLGDFEIVSANNCASNFNSISESTFRHETLACELLKFDVATCAHRNFADSILAPLSSIRPTPQNIHSSVLTNILDLLESNSSVAACSCMQCRSALTIRTNQELKYFCSSQIVLNT